VAHEYAHLCAAPARERGERSHGPTWQRFMRDFGYPPERISTYDSRLTASIPKARRTVRYVYEGVNCGHRFLFNGQMHRKAGEGRLYYCGKAECVHTRPLDQRGIAFTGRKEFS
jgi:predicted SprT family Zn-dependent metalloprotease